eukprot:1160377-Pelagomonas_calceolata.AAC.11
MLSHHAASLLLPAGPSKHRMQLDVSVVCQCGGLLPAHSRPAGSPGVQQPSARGLCRDKDDTVRWQGGVGQRRSAAGVVVRAAQGGKMDAEVSFTRARHKQLPTHGKDCTSKNNYMQHVWEQLSLRCR